MSSSRCLLSVPLEVKQADRKRMFQINDDKKVSEIKAIFNCNARFQKIDSCY